METCGSVGAGRAVDQSELARRIHANLIRGFAKRVRNDAAGFHVPAAIVYVFRNVDLPPSDSSAGFKVRIRLLDRFNDSIVSETFR